MKFILQWLPWTASVIILAHIVSGFPGLVQDGVSDNVPIPGCQFAFHTANMSRRNPQYVQDHLAKRDMVPAGYQSFNGQGNNEDHPDWGAAGAIYLRKSPPMYGDNVNASPGGKNWPNPRNVSQYAFSLTPYPYHMSISELLPMWGSVVHSDVTVTIRDGEYFPIPVPAGDPILDPSATGTFVIPLLRTKYTGLKPEEGLNGTQNTRIMRNEFSAFIDASGLYGLDDATAAQVRGANGTLKSVNYTVLGEAPPLHPATGFFMFALEGGNAVPNFSVYYILLLREHNRRARQLLAVNPTWTSDKVFFEARRWVIAMVQRITMDYYYPLLLGVQAPPYRGYNSSIDPGIDIAFTTCAMRYGHSAINQMIYRLDENGDPIPAGHQLLEEAFWSSNVRSLLDVGIEPYIRGFATQPEQAVDGRYAPAVRNRLRFVKYPFVFDLIAVNIQRSREVGIADYNTLRETYNLSRAATWADITSDVEVRTRLEQLYGNSMDNIDAYVGMVIEDKVGNAVIGPLSATIIKEQLERIRDGDPYWYENPGIFTPEELVEIKETMKPGNLVLSNTNITHFPENPFVVAHQSAAAADLARSKLASGELSFLISDVMKLSWTITKDIITFVVESNSQGWFGFGFGKDMMKSDIFLFSRQSKGSSWHGQDSYSQNVIKPTADADIGGIDDMTDLIRVNKTSFKNAFKFSRRLDTNDPFDVPITNVDMSMIFAWGETELGYHGPQCRGHAVVNFFTGASSVEEDSRLFNLSLFHGIAMFVGFAYVYPVGIYIARYWKNGGTWLIYHQGLMALVSSELMMSAGVAIVGDFGKGHTTHTKIGLFTIVLVVGITFLGKCAGNWDNRFTLKYSAYIRRMHWILGYTTYFFGLCNGFLGVQDITAGTRHTWLRWAYIPGVLLMPVCLLIAAAFTSREKHVEVTKDTREDGPTSNGMLPYFSWETIHERVSIGSKWMVIRSVIYDAELFIDKHPGGRQLIYQSLGLDATELFYGRTTKRKSKGDKNSQKFSSFDHIPGMSFNHKHSRLAEALIANTAVGRVAGRFGEGKPDEESTGDSLKRTNSQLPPGFFPPFARDYNAPRSPLSSDVYKIYTLLSNNTVTKNGCTKPTRLFRFSFPRPDDTVYFFPGQSVLLQYVTEEGKVITRPYTPIRSMNVGYLDMYIKVIEGAMTSHLIECKVIRIRGPSLNTAAMNANDRNGCWDIVGMIAGGSGLTPMLLTIDYHLRYASRDPESKRLNTQMSLLNINRSDEDIFASDVLDKAVSDFMGNLQVTHLCHNVGDSDMYKGESGQITTDILRRCLPPPQPRPPLSRAASFGDAMASKGSVRPGLYRSLAASVERGTTRAARVLEEEDETSQFLGDRRALPSVSEKEKERMEAASQTKAMVVLVCGPPSMNVAIVERLIALKYPEESVIVL